MSDRDRLLALLTDFGIEPQPAEDYADGRDDPAFLMTVILYTGPDDAVAAFYFDDSGQYRGLSVNESHVDPIPVMPAR